MLKITSRAGFDATNKFIIYEVYVSDDKEAYVLRREDNFVPYPYPVTVEEVVKSQEGTVYPLTEFSSVRRYKDEDAKTLAAFIKNKISKVDLTQTGAERTLFEVLNNFGDPI